MGTVPVIASCTGASAVDPNPSPHVDPTNPGPAELPSGLLAEPVAWGRWTLVAAATIGASAWLVSRRRRRRAPTPEAALAVPVEPPQVRALERLAHLRDAAPGAFHVEAADILREYVGLRFGVRVRERTSEEIVATVPPPAARLACAFAACDLAKFARQPAGDADRARLLDEATAFVTETSS